MSEKHEFGRNWTEEKLKMVDLCLTLDLPIEQKIIEDNTVSVISL